MKTHECAATKATKTKNRLEFLKKAPVSQVLLLMGIPTMIGMMINALYSVVDAYFVGQLGTSEMGAITIAFPIGQVIVGIGLLFGNGAASYISRLLGCGDKEKADIVSATTVYSAIGTAFVAITFILVFLHPLLKLLGATESIMPFAIEYCSVYVASLLFNVFNVTMNNVTTSEGAAKTTMIALLTGAVVNIILDPIFITVLKFGVRGAAIATAIAQMVSSSIYIWYILTGKSIFSFNSKKIRWSKEIAAEIFKIGIPTLIFQFLTSLSIAITNMKAGLFGDSCIAAMGASTRIIAMGSLIIFGFTKGFQPLAGFSYGAKNFSRLHEAIAKSILWSTIFCTVYGLVLVIFPAQIVGLFTKSDAAMIEIGSKALRVNAITFMLFGFCTVYSSLLLAIGKGRSGFLVGSLRQGLCFVPAILILPELLGVAGIIWAQPTADILTALYTTIVAIKIKKAIATQQLQ